MLSQPWLVELVYIAESSEYLGWDNLSPRSFAVTCTIRPARTWFLPTRLALEVIDSIITHSARFKSLITVLWSFAWIDLGSIIWLPVHIESSRAPIVLTLSCLCWLALLGVQLLHLYISVILWPSVVQREIFASSVRGDDQARRLWDSIEVLCRSFRRYAYFLRLFPWRLRQFLLDILLHLVMMAASKQVLRLLVTQRVTLPNARLNQVPHPIIRQRFSCAWRYSIVILWLSLALVCSLWRYLLLRLLTLALTPLLSRCSWLEKCAS